MEDNKKQAKAFVDKYFPVNNSKSKDVLSDLFPPNSQQEHSRMQGYEGQSSRGKSPAADGYSEGKGNKNQRSGNAVVLPCSMGSSVDYGCRDDYYPNPQPNGHSATSYEKKEGKEGYDYQDPEHSRGEWWQGSLYY